MVLLSSLLDRLRGRSVQDAGAPLDESELKRFATPLPDEFVATLRFANGFSVHGGMNRLFGFRSDPYMDVRAWNDEKNWRFAWDDRIAPFLCIGETAFGDQYALRRDGRGFASEIYLLEGNFMRAEVLGDSFAEFLEQEFVRNAEEPWDEMAVEVVQSRGAIDVARNLVYSPSIALGGSEDMSNLMEMDCFAAMTIAGDIASAIATAPSEATLTGVSPWTDDGGRSRLRVDFSL